MRNKHCREHLIYIPHYFKALRAVNRALHLVCFVMRLLLGEHTYRLQPRCHWVVILTHVHSLHIFTLHLLTAVNQHRFPHIDPRSVHKDTLRCLFLPSHRPRSHIGTLDHFNSFALSVGAE